jgi:hypothetical protein
MLFATAPLAAGAELALWALGEDVDASRIACLSGGADRHNDHAIGPTLFMKTGVPRAPPTSASVRFGP